MTVALEADLEATQHQEQQTLQQTLQDDSGTKKPPKGMDTQRNLAENGSKALEKHAKTKKFLWVSFALGGFLALQ